MFSSVVSSGRPAKISVNCALNAAKASAIGISQTFDAEIPRERERVVDAAPRRIWARHGNAEDVFRAERIGGNRGDDRGIDSAAQVQARRDLKLHLAR